MDVQDGRPSFRRPEGGKHDADDEHGVLFALLGGISLFIFPQDVLPDQRWRANWYRAFGALIWLSIVLMPALSSLAGSFYNSDHVFLILETVCVMAFSVSFILRGQPAEQGLDEAADEPPYAVASSPAEPVGTV